MLWEIVAAGWNHDPVGDLERLLQEIVGLEERRVELVAVLELHPEQPLGLAGLDETRRVGDVVVRAFARELSDPVDGRGAGAEPERAEALPHVVTTNESDLG